MNWLIDILGPIKTGFMIGMITCFLIIRFRFYWTRRVRQENMFRVENMICYYLNMVEKRGVVFNFLYKARHNAKLKDEHAAIKQGLDKVAQVDLNNFYNQKIALYHWMAKVRFFGQISNKGKLEPINDELKVFNDILEQAKIKFNIPT